MPNTTHGSTLGAKIFGTSKTTTPVSFTQYLANTTEITGSGFIMPTVSNYDLTHNASSIQSSNGSGDIDASATYGEFLEATFELVPQGTTIGNAELSCRIPQLGSTFVIANANVVSCGSFADAINSGSGSRWIYEGGGSLRASSDGFATVSLTLRRYPNIAATTAALVS
jgi:hypothetical protein